MIYVTLAIVLIAVPVILLAALSLLSRRPANLGVTGGRLADCPSSPNCISSRAPDPGHCIAPLALAGPPEKALKRLEKAIAFVPRVRVVTRTEDYMHAEARSGVFRFVDDLEFLVEREEGVIHVRSASRAGYSDFGVNRKRMERIREEFSRLGALSGEPRE